MKDVCVAVTGDEKFVRRHRPLFDAIAASGMRVGSVTSSSRTLLQKIELTVAEIGFVLRNLRRSGFPTSIDELRRRRRAFLLSASSFKTKSRFTERDIHASGLAPNIILHVFGMYGPRSRNADIPYVHYLDYTTALSRRNWPPNVPPLSEAAFSDWFKCERGTYKDAAHIFAMSDLVRRSLIEDYDVPPSQVSAVGSGGQFDLYCGPKRFGSKQILFNGRPFGLKGGDLVVEAFERVRSTVPEATLIIVGDLVAQSAPNVLNPGFIADKQEMRRLFLSSDLVVAPSRADSYPGFVIEAMSHKVPCVVSAVGGMPEIVDDGVSGVVLARCDVENLASTIVGLLADLPRLERLSEGAHRKARERFTWPIIGAAIARKLREIVADGREDGDADVC